MTVRTATRKAQRRQGLTDWFVGMMQTTGENGCSVDLEHQSATRPRNHFFLTAARNSSPDQTGALGARVRLHATRPACAGEF